MPGESFHGSSRCPAPHSLPTLWFHFSLILGLLVHNANIKEFESLDLANAFGIQLDERQIVYY